MHRFAGAVIASNTMKLFFENGSNPARGQGPTVLYHSLDRLSIPHAQLREKTKGFVENPLFYCVLFLPERQADALARCFGILIAAGGNGDVHDAGANSVEVNNLLVVLTAGLASVYDLTQFRMEILILE